MADITYPKSTKEFMLISMDSIKPQKKGWLNVNDIITFANSQQPPEDKIRLAAPQTFDENIAHTWEPIENIVKGITALITRAEKEVGGGVKDTDALSPLTYESSNRREISLSFELTARYPGEAEDINTIIDIFKKKSCPNITSFLSDRAEYDLPYFWRIKSTYNDGITGYPNENHPLIYIKMAALVAVQTSFEAPFLFGKTFKETPAKTILTLTFNDILPLSYNTFKEGIPVSVGGQ